MTLSSETKLHPPARLQVEERDGLFVLLDPEAPNWLATDDRGAWIVGRFAGGRAFGDVVRKYASRNDLSWPEAWQHVDTVVRDALRHKMLTDGEPANGTYPGREAFLNGQPLAELWLHTNNSCNLSCSHCLVSSGPDGDPGRSTEFLLDVMAQARALGTKLFYLTGGEPLLREDIGTLCEYALEDPEAELAILTNGILLRGRRLEALTGLDRERLRLQISLDGSSPTINDPIRGKGSFHKIVEGIKIAVQAGFHVTVTTAITETNVDDVTNVTRLVAETGARNHHLLWLHKRGRADGDDAPDRTPSVEQVIGAVRSAHETGKQLGVTLDNVEALMHRINAPAGVKRDLSNACVTSLCVYADGSVYPSAAMAGVPELLLGDVTERPLEQIWKESPLAQEFRSATVLQKPICIECPYEYVCGGGDIEHAYFYGDSLTSHDPYCELHQAMIGDALFERAAERRKLVSNGASGFTAPVAFTSMGEGSIHCASGEPIPEVVVSHSECVLSFEMDAPRKLVREFYGAAAEKPQEDLCCPVQPATEDVSHIPPEVIERFYGCGSPVGLASIREGETTLDLGSGAGIDVFIAAKKVGPEGKAIGVDMTDQMLAVANDAKTAVARNLGYDATDFRKGFLEEIPADDASVDLVTSNCVINLSPDKKQVFAEMWRILKDHGRIVVSDIVSAEEVPEGQRRDPRLWGECISGALTEEEFIALLERAGFYGIKVLSKTFWREVEGHRFYSVTVRGYKYEKKQGCVFQGQAATYLGPFKGISDEEGHFFPRGVPVEVCTDTAAKLSKAPYEGSFLVAERGEEAEGTGEDDNEAGCSPGCC